MKKIVEGAVDQHPSETLLLLCLNRTSITTTIEIIQDARNLTLLHFMVNDNNRFSNIKNLF